MIIAILAEQTTTVGDGIVAFGEAFGETFGLAAIIWAFGTWWK